MREEHEPAQSLTCPSALRSRLFRKYFLHICGVLYERSPPIQPAHFPFSLFNFPNSLSKLFGRAPLFNCARMLGCTERSVDPRMSPASKNSFSARAALKVGNESYEIFRLEALERAGIGKVSRLPFSLKVLLENLLRHEDNQFVRADDVRVLASWALPPPLPPKKKFPSCPPASCSRILRASPPSWTSPRCAKPCARSVATRKKSIRSFLPSS